MSGARDDGVRITWVGAFVNLALGIGKTVVGFLAGSRALLADGVHSLTDLATDLVVLISIRFSRAAPDPDHPYGHGRIETVGSALLGLFLAGVAAGILWDAVRALWGGGLTRPGPVALVLAAVSILLKEVLYRYTIRVGKRTGSDLLVANAWHHRSDALTSVATLVGVGGAILGPTWLDPAAAILVAVIVGIVAVGILRSSVLSLIDTAVDPEVREAAETTILETPGVIQTHDLKTRRFGRGFYVDVHIEVDAGLNVVEAHEIAECARDHVMSAFGSVLDVVVHVDPWPAEQFDRGHADERIEPE